MQKEIWRDVIGYEGSYQVSNQGRVKSMERVIRKGKSFRKVPERILSYNANNVGYLYVDLWSKGKRDRQFVHRMVAQHFIPNPDALPQINHKDENPTNNNAENLEWCSAKYNINYGKRNLKSSLSQMNSVLTSRPIIQYDKDGNYIAEYPSTREVSRIYGWSDANIRACASGRNRHLTAYGFIWKYKTIP